MRVDTRRFPRSLKEAFPEERYPALEINRKMNKTGDSAVIWTCVLAVLGLMIFGWLGWLS